MRYVTRTAFSLIEILVVIGIIGLLLAFLLPSLEKAREQANNLRCTTNIYQIGVSLAAYANENHGVYPRTTYDPAAPLCVGTNAAAPDPFGPGGPQANDLSTPFFLLMRSQNLPRKLFNEPYNDEVENQPEPAKDLSVRSNFTDYTKNLGYSIANPYPDARAVAAGYQFANHFKPSFALAACLNPGTGPGKNSRNHEGKGQNVLYADYHAEWKTVSACGFLDGQPDEIYVNKAGTAMASPIDATDSVLLPTDK